jgi:hypothetical protein
MRSQISRIPPRSHNTSGVGSDGFRRSCGRCRCISAHNRPWRRPGTSPRRCPGPTTGGGAGRAGLRRRSVVKGRNLGRPGDGTKAACAAELGKTGGLSGFPRLHLREDDGHAVGVVGRGCYAGSASADRSWLMDRARRKAPSGQTTRSSCPGNDESPWIESEGRWARSNHWLSPHSVRKESAIRS